MRHQAERDIHALELGFLADGVVAALRALERKTTPSELDLERLNEAVNFLRELSEWAGPPAPQQSQSLQLSALGSFGYATEALRSGRVGQLTDGIKSYFDSLANLLQTATTSSIDPKALVDATRFFEALSMATLDRWNASQSPTILTPR